MGRPFARVIRVEDPRRNALGGDDSSVEDISPCQSIVVSVHDQTEAENLVQLMSV